MSKQQAFLLADIGEGLTQAEILQRTVRVGDTVEINQIIVEIETTKAAVELPSPYAGVVTALHAEAGETVFVGKPIITIAAEPPATEAASAPDREALLVEYGPQEGGGSWRRRRVSAPSPAATAPPPAAAQRAATPRTAAKPPVSKLAKDLGVDIATVTPTGPGGTISRDDVRRAAEATTSP